MTEGRRVTTACDNPVNDLVNIAVHLTILQTSLIFPNWHCKECSHQSNGCLPPTRGLINGL